MNKLPVYRDHPCKDGNDIIFRVGYARLSDFPDSGIIFHLGFGAPKLIKFGFGFDFSPADTQWITVWSKSHVL